MTEPKRAINLLRGYPNPALLPVELLNEATNRLLGNRQIAEQSLLYGPDAGWPPLLEALSKWLGAFYSPVVLQKYNDERWVTGTENVIPSKRLVATCGASQSLAVILNVLTDPIYTRKVWIVAPAYFLAFRMFEDAGFQGRMRGVPECASGPDTGADVEWLWRELKKDRDAYQQQTNTSEKLPQVSPHAVPMCDLSILFICFISLTETSLADIEERPHIPQVISPCHLRRANLREPFVGDNITTRARAASRMCP